MPRQADPRRPRGPLGRPCGRRPGTYRFDPSAHAGPRSSPSTPRHRRFRARSTWDRSSATCRPMPSPATGGCGAGSSSTRWAGTTTGCPPSAGCRTYFGVTLRPVTPLRPRFQRCPRSRGKDDVPVSRPNFIALCARAHRRGRAGLRGPVAPRRAVGRLEPDLRHHRRPQPAARSQRMFLRNLARRRGLLRRRRPPCGTSTSRRRWRRPRWRTASSQGRLPPGRASRRHRDRDHPARADRRLRGAGRPPRRRALSRAGSATTVRTPLFGVEVPVLAHHLAEPDKGIGHRHDLHVRRRHRRACGGASSTCRPAAS